jgi:hypothetical protein
MTLLGFCACRNVEHFLQAVYQAIYDEMISYETPRAGCRLVAKSIFTE